MSGLVKFSVIGFHGLERMQKFLKTDIMKILLRVAKNI